KRNVELETKEGAESFSRRFDEEVVVFEDAQQPEVAGDAEQQPAFARFRTLARSEAQPDEIVERGGENDQSEVAPVPRGVEDTGGEKNEEQTQPRAPCHDASLRPGTVAFFDDHVPLGAPP